MINIELTKAQQMTLIFLLRQLTNKDIFKRSDYSGICNVGVGEIYVTKGELRSYKAVLNKIYKKQGVISYD